MSTATLVHGYRIPLAELPPKCWRCGGVPVDATDECEECTIQVRAVHDPDLVWCMFPLVAASTAYRQGCRCSRHSTRKRRG